MRSLVRDQCCHRIAQLVMMEEMLSDRTKYPIRNTTYKITDKICRIISISTWYPYILFRFEHNRGLFQWMASPGAYEHFDTKFLDFPQKRSEIYECSKNRTRSADLLTSITRLLIKMLT